MVSQGLFFCPRLEVADLEVGPGDEDATNHEREGVLHELEEADAVPSAFGHAGHDEVGARANQRAVAAEASAQG